MKEWFEERNIDLLDRYALSPDLNPIENCWDMLARTVYDDGKQYRSVEELKESIQACWSRLELQFLQNIVNSMPNRLRGVLVNEGVMTKYQGPWTLTIRLVILNFPADFAGGLIPMSYPETRLFPVK